MTDKRIITGADIDAFPTPEEREIAQRLTAYRKVRAMRYGFARRFLVGSNIQQDANRSYTVAFPTPYEHGNPVRSAYSVNQLSHDFERLDKESWVREDEEFLDKLRANAVTINLRAEARHVLVLMDRILEACRELATKIGAKNPSSESLFKIIVGESVLSLIITSYSEYFDSYTRIDKLLIGEAGSFMGMSVYSDAYYLPKLRRVKENELFILPAPSHLGMDAIKLAEKVGPILVSESEGITQWEIFDDFLEFGHIRTENVAAFLIEE